MDLGRAELMDCLTRLRMSQAELARVIGRRRETVCRWGTFNGVDPVVLAFLRERLTVRRLESEAEELRAELAACHETIDALLRDREAGV